MIHQNPNNAFSFLATAPTPSPFPETCQRSESLLKDSRMLIH